MTTGLQGTFVISCRQTEIDGLPGWDLSLMNVGSTWRWSGEATCVDAPRNFLKLGDALGQNAVRQRAARSVRRILGGVLAIDNPGFDEELEDSPGGGFVVTDGHHSYCAALIDGGSHGSRLLVFENRVPPADCDLWVVEKSLPHVSARRATKPADPICFVAGTPIATPDGPKRVEDLEPGDQVETRDDGPQPLIWVGHRKISGARLHAMPAVRPVMLEPGVIRGVAHGALMLSPDHKVVVEGREPEILFGQKEVLVAARDLASDTGSTRTPRLNFLVYHHLMFERHQVIWAAGAPCESFHPADTDLDALPDAQRLNLIDVAEPIYRQPESYGDPARRRLDTAEAALLRFGLTH